MLSLLIMGSNCFSCRLVLICSWPARTSNRTAHIKLPGGRQPQDSHGLSRTRWLSVTNGASQGSTKLTWQRSYWICTVMLMAKRVKEITPSAPGRVYPSHPVGLIEQWISSRSEGLIDTMLGRSDHDLASRSLKRQIINSLIEDREPWLVLKTQGGEGIRFRHLQRLLFVHGQWCYHRISYTMLLYYFKCVAWVTLNIIFTFYSGFSANSWHSSLIFTLFTLTLTSVPNLTFGMFERHMTDEQLMENAKLYRSISRNANLRLSHLILFVLDGVWHGLVVFYSVYLFLAGGGQFAEAVYFDSTPHGNHFDIGLCGGSSMVYIIVSVNLRVLFMSRDINWPVVGGYIFTLLLNLLLIMVVQFVVPPSSLDFLTYIKIMQSPAFWFALPISVIVANLPAMLWRVSSDFWLQTQTNSETDGVESQQESQRTQMQRMSLRQWLGINRRSQTSQPRSLRNSVNNLPIFVKLKRAVIDGASLDDSLRGPLVDWLVRHLVDISPTAQFGPTKVKDKRFHWLMFNYTFNWLFRRNVKEYKSVRIIFRSGFHPANEVIVCWKVEEPCAAVLSLLGSATTAREHLAFYLTNCQN
ncbi:LOW QUALITY PROTEIN: hypothetical protein T265_12661 [Opisthorchis viverrini]|uniref:P-type ATPase C-terminal domain-containing protein n=1 Tax=Opisthorchis viverrini TaxID=6198 RepID=A0A075A0J9_OPIVI|nr:LOW QUALITY PROTEIN: hypothetical protein T265_12661 [Opisthorchis viverrini]KER33203.1 LOW QUALITY PROTEIN: hypothetical protein T265_12661 [Opisthorchis viverrini]